MLAPLLPPRLHRGHPASGNYCEIVKALMYLLRGGLPWRMLPRGVFPPMTTVQHFFDRWRDNGRWLAINHELLMVAGGSVPGSLAIVPALSAAKGFQVQPRRRVVERTLAWLNRNRGLAKDFERTILNATA